LEPAVPESDAIVAAVVESVMRGGVAAADVTVLRTSEEARAEGLDPRRMLTGDLRQQVRLETHDPDERGHLGYLAATPKGRPIYLNRSVCDADLVVLVGCMRPEHAVTYHGAKGGLYPTFSDAQTQRRFRHPKLINGDADLVDRARGEVKRVGWLAGMQFTVQVIPGADDTALAIFSGEADSVERAGRDRCRTAWEPTVPQRASLVMSALSGGANQQTWDNVGRALAGALRIVADDGVIVLCTELSEPPGPALEQLVDAEDPHAALHKVQKLRLADTLPATELAEALQRVRVYLLSQLDETLVEDLGMGAVTDAEDLVRLARRHPSCILLADAQYALPSATEDAIA
jgi:nickel-dependent lactate racemase